VDRTEVDVTAVLACIEIGGSGAQTVTFEADGTARFWSGAIADADRVAIAVPGIVERGRVVAASNLGWFDVDPAEALHLGRSADVVLNDGEAQALGEAALRGVDDLTLVALGTGVGGAVVNGGAVVADNLFGHATGYSERPCLCGATGCLETVAAGWAMPEPLPPAMVEPIARALAHAIAREPVTRLVVVAGGMTRRHPGIVESVAALLTDHDVEASAAPEEAKSAAAWGLRHVVLGEGVRRA
jgi:hypothetical protein